MFCLSPSLLADLSVCMSEGLGSQLLRVSGAEVLGVPRFEGRRVGELHAVHRATIDASERLRNRDDGVWPPLTGYVATMQLVSATLFIGLRARMRTMPSRCSSVIECPTAESPSLVSTRGARLVFLASPPCFGLRSSPGRRDPLNAYAPLGPSIAPKGCWILQPAILTEAGCRTAS